MSTKLSLLTLLVLSSTLLGACSDKMNEPDIEMTETVMMDDTTTNDMDDGGATTDDDIENESQYSCDMADHPSVGSTAILSTLHHMVSGTVKIEDNCTLSVTNFTYDGEGPSVYFYGALDGQYDTENGGFAMGMQLNGRAYANEDFTVKLTSPAPLDKMNSISVWCADFSVSFGDGQFQ
ncbi:DM13 domain-containing protein [Psychrosphaera sp. B3R10]|uniref:DM13 domain-containing protein n=1 Tax=unclassified Psychrosphaera TaxID=2641570 RepID=UPI001C08D54C|nr:MULTISPECIES: DM13 domain-containing protein [unclassified Psychrosphaera]MBU2882405.1 DM13 domain-containing protein [Psychrosphaera sp. I2R16]MBU2989086.1 DM13 domain-containing protein [Psychrosphaera sp. B3R10]MDO6718082.1 DM13 domain-containing protein [Psychrosphaera sp. 1_MG-2023]